MNRRRTEYLPTVKGKGEIKSARRREKSERAWLIAQNPLEERGKERYLERERESQNLSHNSSRGEISIPRKKKRETLYLVRKGEGRGQSIPKEGEVCRGRIVEEKGMRIIKVFYPTGKKTSAWKGKGYGSFSLIKEGTYSLLSGGEGERGRSGKVVTGGGEETTRAPAVHQK